MSVSTSDSTEEMINTTVSIQNCSYSYDFAVENNGQIIIKNLKTNYSLEITEYDGEAENKSTKRVNKDTGCEEAKPDHKEGVYSFKNGVYLLGNGK